MRALGFDSIQVRLRYDHSLLVFGGLCDDLSRGVANKTLAPELDTGAAIRRFVADAVWHGDVAAIGHGMAALNDFP